MKHKIFPDFYLENNGSSNAVPQESYLSSASAVDTNSPFVVDDIIKYYLWLTSDSTAQFTSETPTPYN